MKDKRQYQLKPLGNNLMEPPQIQQIDDIIAINYSIHMHPITRIKIPDFMDQDKQSLIDITCGITYSMMPMILNFFLNHASSYTNIFIIGMYNDKQLFCKICLGNIIAYTLVYYIIEYLAAGFAIICTYFTQKQQIGFLYQKTLGITYLICVFMTPVIFVSDKFLNIFQFDDSLILQASIYAWALVPSYYLQSFLHVNKNYLQTQGIIFPPILIHLISFIAHIAICAINHSIHPLTMKRVAWIKNITDGLCCLLLYLFIIIKQPTKESWVQWSIKSTHNIQKFLKEIVYHESFTYFEIMAFQIVSTIACLLSFQSMTAHFSFSLIYMLFYFCFVSLSHCINKSIALSIEDNQIQNCKKKVSIGCLMASVISILAIINIIQHRNQFTAFFVDDAQVKAQMMSVLTVFCVILLIQGLNIVTTGIVKALEVEEVWKYSFILYYIIGISMSSILCYYFQNGVKGIWVGWLISILISLAINIKSILSLDFQQVFERMRDRYKMIKEDIRQSKMHLIQDN